MKNTITQGKSSSSKVSWLNMVALAVLLALGGSGCERIPEPQVTSKHLDTTTGIHQAAIAQIIEKVNPGLFHYDDEDSTNIMRLGGRHSNMGMDIGNVHDPLVYDSNVSPSIKEGDIVYIDLNHQNYVETIETGDEMKRDYSPQREIGARDAGVDLCDSAKVTNHAKAVVRAVRDHQPSDIGHIYFGNQAALRKLLEEK